MARTKRSTTGSPTRAKRRRSRRNRRPQVSKRYTPPIPAYKKRSSKWVAVLLFALLGLGFLTIFVNYLGILPGGASNWYLLIGIGMLGGGFFTATKYR